MQIIDYQIQKTQIEDIPSILAIFDAEVAAGRMLARNQEELKKNIDLWRAVKINNQIVGCVSLVFFNPSLCEIRSLAVAEEFRTLGLGKLLLEAAIDLADELNAKTVFALTRSPWVFERLGFRKTIIQKFPEKVWQDCKPCPFINQCDEIAMYFNLKESEIDYE
jgi:amino-acid N-acetyltransferase